MSDTKLNVDEWDAHCPICKEIIRNEVWPRELKEVTAEMTPPPCPFCEADLEYNWLTVPNKAMRGMVHNMMVSCPSCGSGHSYEGVDVVTNRAKVTLKLPPQYDFKAAQKEIDSAGDEESKARAKAHAEDCLKASAMFRIQNFPCLDDGWDAMGYGVRPLERTEIMQKFYIWTNKEAVGEATQEENPLKAKMSKKGKKKKWW
jgi:uncharacterized protein (UPF0212 family)